MSSLDSSTLPSSSTSNTDTSITTSKLYNYWNNHFQNGTMEEWFASYSILKSYLMIYLLKPLNILIVGCGNSELSYDIYNDYRNQNINHIITSIDISDIVISQMIEKYKNYKNLRWKVADICELQATFEKGEFDIVIDKGCADTLLFRTHGKKQAEKLLSKMWRSLYYVLSKYDYSELNNENINEIGSFIMITLRKKPPFIPSIIKNWSSDTIKINTNISDNNNIDENEDNFDEKENDNDDEISEDKFKIISCSKKVRTKLFIHNCKPSIAPKKLSSREKLILLRKEYFDNSLNFIKSLPSAVYDEVKPFYTELFHQKVQNLKLSEIKELLNIDIIAVSEFNRRYVFEHVSKYLKPDTFLLPTLPIGFAGIVVRKIMISSNLIFLDIVQLITPENMKYLALWVDELDGDNLRPESSKVKVGNTWEGFIYPEFVKTLPLAQVLCERYNDHSKVIHKNYFPCPILDENFEFKLATEYPDGMTVSNFAELDCLRPNDIVLCTGVPGINLSNKLVLRASSITLLQRKLAPRFCFKDLD